MARDKPEMHLFYCSGGIRHKDGVNCMEALIWNIGTCRLDAKGKAQAENCKCESTDEGHRGGLIGSSDEAFVMNVERSNQIIQPIEFINQ